MKHCGSRIQPYPEFSWVFAQGIYDSVSIGPRKTKGSGTQGRAVINGDFTQKYWNRISKCTEYMISKGYVNKIGFKAAPKFKRVNKIKIVNQQPENGIDKTKWQYFRSGALKLKQDMFFWYGEVNVTCSLPLEI